LGDFGFYLLLSLRIFCPFVGMVSPPFPLTCGFSPNRSCRQCFQLGFFAVYSFSPTQSVSFFCFSSLSLLLSVFSFFLISPPFVSLAVFFFAPLTSFVARFSILFCRSWALPLIFRHTLYLYFSCVQCTPHVPFPHNACRTPFRLFPSLFAGRLLPPASFYCWLVESFVPPPFLPAICLFAPFSLTCFRGGEQKGPRFYTRLCGYSLPADHALSWP